MKPNSHDDKVAALETHGAVQRVLSPKERVRLMRRCREAGELEEAGDYESARHALSEWWPVESDKPRTDGLDHLAAAELLLRAGTLTGRLVSTKLTKGAQARARAFLEESFDLFEQAGHVLKAAEARAELAWVHRREGDYKGARCLLRKALAAMGNSADGCRAKAVTLLRAALAEYESDYPAEALNILRESAPLLEACDDIVLLGKFHTNLGLVFMALGQETGREDFLDSAIVQYTAAGYHFAHAQKKAARPFAQEKAERFIALNENNYGYVLFLLREFEEAAERLQRAHRIFIELGDAGHAAEVMETQARLLLAQGRCEEAAHVAAMAVRALEAGERTVVLAEALTTMGVAQARSSCFEESRKTLERAIELAETAGAQEIAGLAVLSALEELRGHLNPVETRKLYERAHIMLAQTHHYGMLNRLKEIAHEIIAAAPAKDSPAARPAKRTDCVFVNSIPETSFRRTVLRLSGSRAPVLITGENAEQRRLMARMTHEQSGRYGTPVVVNCAAEEESPAMRDFLSRGARRAAHGTLFLDEVQGLSRKNQERLLRLIRHGVIERGRTTPQSEFIDVHVIVGTSCDLSERVESEFFLPELFEALNDSCRLRTPSAEALEELRVMAGCLIKEYLESWYAEGTRLPEAATRVVHTPVAEAAGVLARQFARMSAGATSQNRCLPDWSGAKVTTSVADDAVEAGGQKRLTLYELIGQFEMGQIREALEAVGWNQVKAARLLGIPRQTLKNRINRYPELLRLMRANLKLAATPV